MASPMSEPSTRARATAALTAARTRLVERAGHEASDAMAQLLERELSALLDPDGADAEVALERAASEGTPRRLQPPGDSPGDRRADAGRRAAHPTHARDSGPSKQGRAPSSDQAGQATEAAPRRPRPGVLAERGRWAAVEPSAGPRPSPGREVLAWEEAASAERWTAPPRVAVTGGRAPHDASPVTGIPLETAAAAMALRAAGAVAARAAPPAVAAPGALAAALAGGRDGRASGGPPVPPSAGPAWTAADALGQELADALARLQGQQDEAEGMRVRKDGVEAHVRRVGDDLHVSLRALRGGPAAAVLAAGSAEIRRLLSQRGLVPAGGRIRVEVVGDAPEPASEIASEFTEHRTENPGGTAAHQEPGRDPR